MSKPYFPQLDQIKSLAIIMIIAFHTFGQLSGWHMNIVNSEWLYNFLQHLNPEQIFRFIESYFYLGVNLFIISSGFGLAYSELNNSNFNLKNFLQKRLLRILPPAIIATIIVFILKTIAFNQLPINHPHLNLFPFLGGLNLFHDHWFFPPINGETWFLGLIIQLYLLFPILHKLQTKLQPWKFLLLTFIISTTFRTYYYHDFHQYISTASYGWSLARIFEFSFGMHLAKHLKSNTNINPIWLLGFILIPGYFFPLTFPFTDHLLGIALFTLIFNLSTTFPIKSTKLQTIIKQLSTQSYMLFLIHHPIIWLLQPHFQPTIPNQTLIFLITLIITYPLSKSLNHLLTYNQKQPKQSTKLN